MKTKSLIVTAIAALTLIGARVDAQSRDRLSLAEARAMARRASPELEAARAALDAARGREQQAEVMPSPELGYSTERTGAGVQSNSQQILGFEQRIELGGQRSARRSAAALRSRVAEAKVAAATANLDFAVARTYALAVAADRRANLARQAAVAFTDAGRVSARRLAAGDISGYTDRRLRLEAARYSALEAEAVLNSRSARTALSALIASVADSIGATASILTDSLPIGPAIAAVPALQAAALRNRADFHAASYETAAFREDARLAARELIPTPTLNVGLKTEKSAGSAETLRGFAAGFSLPLPLWDRRKGAIQAAEAEVRESAAKSEALRRWIVHEVVDARNALEAIERQREVLAPQLGEQSAAALRSARVAYNEGEITLLEWLDSVRAYHEAEAAYSNLLAEVLTRRAILERVISAPLAGFTNTAGENK